MCARVLRGFVFPEISKRLLLRRAYWGKAHTFFEPFSRRERRDLDIRLKKFLRHATRRPTCLRIKRQLIIPVVSIRFYYWFFYDLFVIHLIADTMIMKKKSFENGILIYNITHLDYRTRNILYREIQIIITSLYLSLHSVNWMFHDNVITVISLFIFHILIRLFIYSFRYFIPTKSKSFFSIPKG